MNAKQFVQTTYSCRLQFKSVKFQQFFVVFSSKKSISDNNFFFLILALFSVLQRSIQIHYTDLILYYSNSNTNCSHQKFSDISSSSPPNDGLIIISHTNFKSDFFKSEVFNYNSGKQSVKVMQTPVLDCYDFKL